MKCDKCDKEMVQRKGSRGPFWGCTGFPMCSNTKQIEDDAKVVVTQYVPHKGQEKPAKSYTTMYVSYAKDIFCAILEKTPFDRLSPESAEILMKDAINTVKQAKEAFE